MPFFMAKALPLEKRGLIEDAAFLGKAALAKAVQRIDNGDDFSKAATLDGL